MLPKIGKENYYSRKEFLVSSLQAEEYIRNLIAKTSNKSYKPWKSKNILQPHLSPFGEFPPNRSHITKQSLHESPLSPQLPSDKLIINTSACFLIISFIQFYNFPQAMAQRKN